MSFIPTFNNEKMSVMPTSYVEHISTTPTSSTVEQMSDTSISNIK